MSDASPSRTEVIVFCSGKGGTGKTSLISALGYALGQSGHRVLLVDADRATDGLSLFMLGPEGMSQLNTFVPESTFTGLLAAHEKTGVMAPQPHRIDRLGVHDHRLSYDAIISDRNIYGDAPESTAPAGASIDRQYDRAAFQRTVQAFFGHVRASGKYDYVLVDSRGGFSFESTDVAAAGDSFIVVTEATYTNFYQDRNLVDRISQAAGEMSTQSVLRAIVVNKSTDPPETSFRNELVREFGVRFEDVFPVSLDVEAMRVYKMQKAVYREAPASRFAYDSLQAFQRILRIVTSQWPVERVESWNALVATVEAAIAQHNAEVETETRARAAQLAQFAEAESERARLASELQLERAAHAQEAQRQDVLLRELREQEGRREARQKEELATLRARADEERRQLELAAEQRLELQAVRHQAADYSLRSEAKFRNLVLVIATLMLTLILATAGIWVFARSQAFRSALELAGPQTLRAPYGAESASGAAETPYGYPAGKR
jgi:MinD-like ATPase involved in chromosome partitioning or flagellar assembly